MRKKFITYFVVMTFAFLPDIAVSQDDERHGGELRDASVSMDGNAASCGETAPCPAKGGVKTSKQDIEEIFKKAEDCLAEIEIKIEKEKRLAAVEARAKQIAELDVEAGSLMANGDFKKAKAVYEKMLKISTENADLKEYIAKADIEARRDETEKLRLQKQAEKTTAIEKANQEKLAKESARAQAETERQKAKEQAKAERQKAKEAADEARAEKARVKKAAKEQAELERAKAKEAERQSKLEAARQKQAEKTTAIEKANQEKLAKESAMKQKKLEYKQKKGAGCRSAAKKEKYTEELQKKAREEESFRKAREAEEEKLRKAKDRAKNEAARRAALEDIRQNEARFRASAEEKELVEEIEETEKLEKGQEEKSVQDIKSLKEQADELYKAAQYEEAEMLYTKACVIAKLKREELMKKKKAEDARQRLERSLERQ